MKNFVKAMHQEGDGFKFLKDFFGAHKSDAKLKAGIFVGPEIRKLMLNEKRKKKKVYLFSQIK